MMYMEGGLEKANKDIKSYSFRCSSYNIKNELIKIVKVIPTITYESSNSTETIRCTYEKFKIPLKNFRECPIDYSLMEMQLDNKIIIQYSKLTWSSDMGKIANILVCGTM